MTATPVRLGAEGLIVGDRRVPLVAGEFNFWRHNPEDWRPILRKMQALGIELVTTFVCWDFHERERGRYVLGPGENPMRNLEGFLDAIADEGLLAILRPGPIIDSEWPTRGPAPDVATLERTDPRFRERAAEWLAAVGPVIASRQAPHGPVVLLQLDNEVFYPHCTEASATEADSAFHIPYDEERVFTDLDMWLSPGDAALPRRTVPLSELDAEQRRTAFSFLTYQVADYLRWVDDHLKQAGVTIPSYSNVKQSCAYLDVGEIGKALIGATGGNNYMDRLHDEDEFLVAVWWNGLQRALTPFPWAPEYWCGRWVEQDQDTSVFRPEHYLFCLLTHVALGLRGLNYFMLVERDDWHYSPITGIGRVREPLAAPVRIANEVLRALGPDDRVADVALVWSLDDHQRLLASRGLDWTELSSIWWEMGLPKEHEEWWETLRALARADLDFKIVERSDPRLADYPVVVVPDGTQEPISNTGRITCAPEDVVGEAERAGARRMIEGPSGSWTALYRSADSCVSGFFVNRSSERIAGRLTLATSVHELDWLVAPERWNGDTQEIELAPRTVAAFHGRS